MYYNSVCINNFGRKVDYVNLMYAINNMDVET